MTDHPITGAPPQYRRILELRLADRLDELTAAMLAPERFRAIGDHGGWLLDRYREILPTVLPDALHCMETGARISPESLAVIRNSAAAMRHSGVPLAVVLRGSIPALRVFGAFIQTRETGLNPHDLTVLMGRAALIAGELGASWAEAWADVRGSGALRHPVVEGEALDFVSVPGIVPTPVLEMLALVASGRSNEQIAAATDYSPQAVKWHLARLMRQWNVENRASLVAVALVRGVLTAR